MFSPEYTPLIMLAIVFGGLAVVGFIAQYFERQRIRAQARVIARQLKEELKDKE